MDLLPVGPAGVSPILLTPLAAFAWTLLITRTAVLLFTVVAVVAAPVWTLVVPLTASALVADLSLLTLAG